MSAPTTTKTSATHSPVKPKDALAPVAVGDTPRAQAVRHAVPAAVAAAFALHFGALVRDPVAAMSTLLAAVAALQILYALVCLPLAGSRDGRAARKPRPGEKRKDNGGGPNLVVVSCAPHAVWVCLISRLLVPSPTHW